MKIRTDSTIRLDSTVTFVECDTSTGSFSLHLPLPRIGRKMVIKKMRNDVYKITIYGIFKNEEDAYLLSSGSITFISTDGWWSVH